jgi:protein SDA1
MRDLAELQNLVKRDKESYKHEFLLQYRHYLSELEIFKFNPAVHSNSFCELVNFLSQVTQILNHFFKNHVTLTIYN